MLVIIGYIVVVGSVLGGFMAHGGKLGALWQPFELVIIGGAALGAFVVGNNGKVLKATFGSLPKVFKGSKYTK
ncbi:MAG: flagellar motor stator protein MotA, partial [Nitrosomonadaceae bacterium]|nr:flagellar motor stator protein MotA [Nitrosomonadaceae bacterium]